MSDVQSRTSSTSGLTDTEAREFHSIFITSFIAFVAVAIVAHILVWTWRPWLPGEGGYRQPVADAAQYLTSFLV